MNEQRSPDPLIVELLPASLGDCRTMCIWSIFHSKRSLFALAAIVAFAVGGLAVAIVTSRSGWNSTAQTGWSFFVGGCCVLAYFSIRVLLLTPRSVSRIAKSQGATTYTLSSEGLAFHGSNANGLMKWSTFVGYANAGGLLLLVCPAGAGAILFPKRLLTADSWTRLNSLVQEYSTPVKTF